MSGARERAAEAIRLAELGAECRQAGVAREVLLVRLSLIRERDFRPHYARLVESALERLGRVDRARLFRLPDHDLALAWRDPGPNARGDGDLEGVSTTTIRMLFSAALVPLPPLDQLLCRFHLPQDTPRLAALLREPNEPPVPSHPRLRGLDRAECAAVERALATADVSRFVRCHGVYRQESTSFERVFEHRFLSLDDIGRALTPGHDLTADPALVRRLQRTLDARMLAELGAPGGLRHAPPFAFALTPESAVSAAFLAFDAALPARLRGSLLIEFGVADILADAPAFVFARDFVRERGYRSILAAPDPRLLPVIPLAPLAIDFMAIAFSPLLAHLSASALGDALGEPTKIILRASGSPETARAAHAWAGPLGITLFEARAGVFG